MSNHDDDDLKAFFDAVRDVRPITTDRAPGPSQRPRPRARFTRQDQRDVLHESLHGDLDPTLLGSGDELFFARPGIGRTILRKLKRGKFRVESELDLHGLTANEARQAVDEFLVECRYRRWTCVRIVHGKGKRSGHQGPVIKPRLARWLRQRDAVLAYSSARPVDGGSGAVYVLLRSGAGTSS